MSKVTLRFKKFTNFTGKYLENSRNKNAKSSVYCFFYEHKHIGRFPDLN